MSTLISNVLLLICIVLFYEVKSQWTEIWYDDMQQNNGWTAPSPPDVDFGYSSSGCPDPLPLCTKITNDNTYDSSIYKSFDISAYNEIRVQLHLTTGDLETNDRCQIYYAYDSQSNKQMLLEYTGLPDDYEFHDNEVYNFPLSASSASFWFWVQVKADDLSHNDNCYINAFTIEGISGPTGPPPTNDPTRRPSRQPTKRPTANPTKHPSPNPTNPPTKRPTNNPTRKPSAPSLLTCGQQARGDYNDETLEFDVRLPYVGDLTFDATASDFVIQSLTAVFGVTPIASDTDFDGILTILDTIPADYTFAVRAPNGIYGTFDVTVSCQSDHPTRFPSVAPSRTPSKSPTQRPTVHPSPNPSSFPTSLSPVKPGNPSFAPSRASSSPTRPPSLGVNPAPLPTAAPPLPITPSPTQKRTTPAPIVSTSDDDSAGSDMISSTRGSAFRTQQAKPENTAGIVLVCIGLICVCAIAVAGVYLYTKRKDEAEINLINIFKIAGKKLKKIGTSMEMTDGVHTNAVDMKAEVRAQTLLDWFTHVAELPQYFHLFIENGYNSFQAMKLIQNEEEIRAIGVTKRGHVALLMFEIRKLKNKEGGHGIPTNMGTVDGTDIVQHTALRYNYHTKKGDGMEQRDTGGAIAGEGQPGVLVTPNHARGVFQTPVTHQHKHDDEYIYGQEPEKNVTGGDFKLSAWNQWTVGVKKKAQKLDNVSLVKANAAAPPPRAAFDANDGNQWQHGVNSNVVKVTAAAPDGERNVSKCVDCSQVKEGRVYDADGQFYCHECWSCYQ